VLLSTLPGKIAGAFNSVRGTPAFQAALAAHPDQAATLQAAGQGNSDLNDTSFISRLAPVIAHPFKVGFSDSMSVVFLMGAAIMVIGFIVVLLLPEIPLADRSAAQARAAEAQAEAGAAVGTAAPVTSAAIADPAGTGAPPADPDADAHGRHNADGHDGEVRVPADGNGHGGRHEPSGHGGEVRVPLDGNAGDGRHDASGHDGDLRVPPGPEADGNGGPVQTDPTAEPVHGRPSAGS
jgi:hypothetical protein